MPDDDRYHITYLRNGFSGGFFRNGKASFSAFTVLLKICLQKRNNKEI